MCVGFDRLSEVIRKRLARPDNPGRILLKYPAPWFWLSLRGNAAQYGGRTFARIMSRYCTRAGLSGPDILEISGPPFLAKDWKKSFSDIGPDFWPDFVSVLFRRPDYPGGADYPALT